MVIDILTIFPKMFSPVVNESIIKRAQQKKLIKINIHDIRKFTDDKHKKVDDRPFGGGPGMVMNAQPIFSAIDSIGKKRKGKKTKTILLSPQGKCLDQKIAKRLSKHKHLILICGHYEGIDERVRKNLADEEISIGDYVLTGGELPAMVLLDSVVRLVPKVLGTAESLKSESFTQDLLEYPQYTRPANFRNMRVPEVLLSGNHKKIQEWRKKKALEKTKKRRPDLIKERC